MSRRFLIVRTDRMGDVLLTTPMSSALRAHFPSARIGWLVRPYTAPLLQNNPYVDDILLDRGGPVSTLAAAIRAFGPDTAIVALPRWRTAWALWRAGVPQRIGPASKIYSALFTKRVWQHRSESVKHEADYNLDLLESLGVPFRRLPTSLVLTEDERQAARKLLAGHRVDLSKPLAILHPGSGGSSARWPLSYFMELGDRLQESGVQAVVTGGPGEDYQYAMIDRMRRIPVFIPAGSVNLRELAAIFSCASIVVSNSTGPLHMAVALQVPTVSIFSSGKLNHPRRWGPYPGFVERSGRDAVALAPETNQEPADLSAVSVDDVLSLCRERLQLRPAAGAPRG
jgi:heptosyltransferase III